MIKLFNQKRWQQIDLDKKTRPGYGTYARVADVKKNFDSFAESKNQTSQICPKLPRSYLDKYDSGEMVADCLGPVTGEIYYQI